jgi:ketosteroid isomerase-like protein
MRSLSEEAGVIVSRSLGLLGVMAIGLALACAPVRRNEFTEAHAAAIRDSVRATLVAYAGRFNAADWDSLSRFYLDDPRFVWAEDGQITYHSVAEIRKAFGAFAGSAWVRMEFPDPRIAALAPGTASVVTSFRQIMADSAGHPFTVAGVMMLAVLHEPGGWKFVSGHTSTEKAAVSRKP